MILTKEQEGLNDAADICKRRGRKHDKESSGKPETRKFLENLGFVAGGTVTVVSTIGGNVIVKVKESRVAVSKEMAAKIMV